MRRCVIALDTVSFPYLISGLPQRTQADGVCAIKLKSSWARTVSSTRDLADGSFTETRMRKGFLTGDDLESCHVWEAGTPSVVPSHVALSALRHADYVDIAGPPDTFDATAFCGVLDASARHHVRRFHVHSRSAKPRDEYPTNFETANATKLMDKVWRDNLGDWLATAIGLDTTLESMNSRGVIDGSLRSYLMGIRPTHLDLQLLFDMARRPRRSVPSRSPSPQTRARWHRLVDLLEMVELLDPKTDSADDDHVTLSERALDIVASFPPEWEDTAYDETYRRWDRAGVLAVDAEINERAMRDFSALAARRPRT